MKGGVTAYDLVESLFVVFANVMNVQDNAYETIAHHIADCHEKPPTYFKMGKIQKVENKEIHILMAQNTPSGMF